jgi:hypothetical protein
MTMFYHEFETHLEQNTGQAVLLVYNLIFRLTNVEEPYHELFKNQSRHKKSPLHVGTRVVDYIYHDTQRELFSL